MTSVAAALSEPETVTELVYFVPAAWLDHQEADEQDEPRADDECPATGGEHCEAVQQE